ncbi:MAG TPA: hypothetical protein VMB05_05140 [Solirubrobacteraceae bacterium]|nr:hypothetical protein [Solirubrobacteraceae bacterium]
MSTLNCLALAIGALCAANAALVLVVSLAAFRHRPGKRRTFER